jgi:riboflavin biosynthesis pyrimidine reductase
MRGCDDAGVQRLLPTPAATVTDQEFRDAYGFPADRPWLRGSMVVSLDGATRGADGSSRSIASAADRRAFSMLRLRGDVVLVGAGTLRSERYRPSRLPIAIVTRRMDLAPDLPIFAEETPTTPRTIIFTTEDAEQRAPRWLREHADVVACGTADVDLDRVVSELEGRGLGRIHCEGGPTLLSSLSSADLVDEFLITVSPMIVGASSDQHLLFTSGGVMNGRRWRMMHLFAEDGTVFVRVGRS